MIAPNFAEGLAYNVHMQWKKFMREFYQTWMQFLGKVLKQIQRQEFNWHVGSMERVPNFTSRLVYFACQTDIDMRQKFFQT